jgi:hypothetical protein
MPGLARSATIISVILLGAAACSDPSSAPRAGVSPSIVGARSAVKFWDANAAANWNERATALAARRPVNVTRLYAYLSLAQLRAAEDAAKVRPHPPTAAAIAAASASVLTSFFAADAAEIAGALDMQAAAEPWPGAKHEDFAAGAAIGRAAAVRVLAYAQGDRFGLTDPGTPPTGPGRWQWSGGPIARGGLGARPFFVASGDELRPPPPPTFGSPAFLAALGEVRQIADTRTAEQLRIAQYWNVNQSPSSDAARNNLAVELLRAHRRSDVESARILFLMNAAAFDAVVGCFAAKYHYWSSAPRRWIRRSHCRSACRRTRRTRQRTRACRARR